MKMLGVFPGKMCSDRRKNHGCGQKKPKRSSVAIFGVETAAKCCELKRCVDRVRNRTDNSNLNFFPDLYRLTFWPKFNFLPSTKKTTEYSCEIFFPLTNLFLTFVVFACFATTRVTMRIRAKNTGFSTGLYPVYATPYWLPCGGDGRTDGRSRDFYVTTKMSWLDRLPNLLSNGAPLTCLRAGSARVQRADRFFTNNPCYLSVLARTLFSLFKRFLYYRVFQNSCMGKAEQVGLSRDIAFEQPPLYGHCYL